MVEKVRIVSRFTVDDQELSELHTRAFRHPEPPGPIALQPWGARLARHSVSWVGAYEGPRLVGFVHACGDGGAHAFLLDAVVDPDYRRQRIGRLVVDRLIDDVRVAGCSWLHVDYEPQLEPFYRACGFRPTAAGLLRLDG